MIRIILTIALLSALVLGFQSDVLAGESPFDAVKGWLDANSLTYVTTDNEIALGFKGEGIPRIDVMIGFSSEFIHFSAPVGEIPSDAGSDYYSRLINLTGSIPMLKPYIDKENFLYLIIDLPLAALSESEVICNTKLLVKFINMHSEALYPWEDE